MICCSDVLHNFVCSRKHFMWLVVVVLAFIHIISIRKGSKWLFYVSKPLPVLCMLGILIQSPAYPMPYAHWILIGLSLSLLGDVLLMLPRDKFITGLVLFCSAHLSYSYGFAIMSAWHLHLGSQLPCSDSVYASTGCSDRISVKKNGQLLVIYWYWWLCAGLRSSIIWVGKHNPPLLQCSEALSLLSLASYWLSNALEDGQYFHDKLSWWPTILHRH